MAEWHKRGWLAPSGTLHSIAAEGTHTDWLLAHPEHWEPGKHQEAVDRINKGEGKHYAVRDANARLLRHGWVRQAGRGMYELSDRRHLRRVLDHVMTNYPDIDRVTVDIGVDKPTTHTISVHEETIPLGQCYSWATKNAREGDTVVHGTVQHPWDGHSFSHAWIERGDRVHDFQTSIGLGPGKQGWTRAAFQDAYTPSQTRRYAPHEAKAHMLRHGHHGPWEWVERVLAGERPADVINEAVGLVRKSTQDFLLNDPDGGETDAEMYNFGRGRERYRPRHGKVHEFDIVHRQHGRVGTMHVAHTDRTQRTLYVPWIEIEPAHERAVNPMSLRTSLQAHFPRAREVRGWRITGRRPGVRSYTLPPPRSNPRQGKLF